MQTDMKCLSKQYRSVPMDKNKQSLIGWRLAYAVKYNHHLTRKKKESGNTARGIMLSCDNIIIAFNLHWFWHIMENFTRSLTAIANCDASASPSSVRLVKYWFHRRESTTLMHRNELIHTLIIQASPLDWKGRDGSLITREWVDWCGMEGGAQRWLPA